MGSVGSTGSNESQSGLPPGELLVDFASWIISPKDNFVEEQIGRLVADVEESQWGRSHSSGSGSSKDVAKQRILLSFHTNLDVMVSFAFVSSKCIRTSVEETSC